MPRPLGDGVVSTCMEGMAPQDAPDAQPRSAQHAVLLYGLVGIFRAGWRVDARRREQGRDVAPVPSDRAEESPLDERLPCPIHCHLALPAKKRAYRPGYVMRVSVVGVLCGKEDDLLARFGKAKLARGFPKHPLAPVAPDGIAQTSCSDEGDLWGVAFVAIENRYPNEPVVGPPTMGEDLLKFPSGFDGLHR